MICPIHSELLTVWHLLGGRFYSSANKPVTNKSHQTLAREAPRIVQTSAVRSTIVSISTTFVDIWVDEKSFNNSMYNLILLK